jgi:hypothetical protein
MKIYFERVINKLYKKDIDVLFGENSKIVITELEYSRGIKNIRISAKLIPTNPEFAVEVFPEGLEIIIQEGWQFMGIDLDLMLTSSIEH